MKYENTSIEDICKYQFNFAYEHKNLLYCGMGRFAIDCQYQTREPEKAYQFGCNNPSYLLGLLVDDVYMGDE